ncbi:MAG: IS3 family transposase, partial [Sulfitobacter sp.]
ARSRTSGEYLFPHLFFSITQHPYFWVSGKQGAVQNCHDNAVAESFFHLLKRERVRRRTFTTRDAARQDVFDYIEMFYNPTRKHTNNGMLSPVDYEMKQQKMNKAGV